MKMSHCMVVGAAIVIFTAVALLTFNSGLEQGVGDFNLENGGIQPRVIGETAGDSSLAVNAQHRGPGREGTQTATPPSSGGSESTDPARRFGISGVVQVELPAI